jgi:cell division protein FtsA
MSPEIATQEMAPGRLVPATLPAAHEMAWQRLLGNHRRPHKNAPFGLLDIGSSKLCCYIVRTRGTDGFVLLGRGYQAAQGFQAGEVVDAEAAEASMLAVVGEAEEAAGEQLREIAVSWSGGRPSAGLVTIECQIGGRVIDDDDIDQALEQIRGSMLGSEREILHILPVEMRPDGGEVLADPRGFAAQTLEFSALVVSVAKPALRNLTACLERCHLDVMELTNATYAAGVGCLTMDEIRRGVLLLELGGGTSSLGLFSGGALCHLAQVPYGGEHVTRDVAYCLSTSRAVAERLKNLYGGVLCRACDDNVRIEVPMIGDHLEHPTGEVPRTRLTEIIRARVEETLLLLESRLQDGRDTLKAKPPRSMVLTGGAAQIEGIEELAEEIFGLKARIGRPAAVRGRAGLEDQPCCSAAAGGLVLVTGRDGGLSWKQASEVPALTSGLARLGHWLKQNFVS